MVAPPPPPLPPAPRLRSCPARLCCGAAQKSRNCSLSFWLSCRAPSSLSESGYLQTADTSRSAENEQGWTALSAPRLRSPCWSPGSLTDRSYLYGTHDGRATHTGQGGRGEEGQSRAHSAAPASSCRRGALTGVIRRSEAGDVGRFDSPRVHPTPVHSLEPPMALDVVCALLQTAESLRPVRGQQLLHQILGVRVEVLRHTQRRRGRTNE